MSFDVESAPKTALSPPYGFCPECGAEGEVRERRPDGNDVCTNGHVYPSKTAVPSTDRTPGTNEAYFAELTREKRQHEARVKEINARLAELETPIQEDWVDRSITSMKIAGMTLYIQTEVRCRKHPDLEGHQFAAILRQNGLVHCIGYNANSLRAAVKGLKGDDGAGEIPEDLAPHIVYEEVPRLRARAS